MFHNLVRSVLLLLILLATANTCLAEVTIKGDARARYILKDNYLFGNLAAATNDYWDSRTRLVIEARSAGGAFAKVRVRSNVNWGDGYRPESHITPTTDFAYIVVPFGAASVETGTMKSNITRFLEWDQTSDQITVNWDLLDIDWTAIYRILDESDFSEVDINRLNNNDHVAYGIVGKKSVTDNWKVQANLFYADDQRDEYMTGDYISSASGFFWSLLVEGSWQNMQLESEFAFKSADVRQSRDEQGFVINQLNIDQGDGWGWYFQGAWSFGPFTPSLNFGIVANGFEADNDFGWVMIGNSNNEPITVIGQVGENGDWYWLAPSLQYRLSEKTNIKGNFVWVSVDADNRDDDTSLSFKNLYELSLELFYTINDSTSLTCKAGWLIPEIEGTYNGITPTEDTAFGSYARLQVVF